MCRSQSFIKDEYGITNTFILSFRHNIKHEKPPATTKVGITAHGGYQAEIHYFLTGLDIEEVIAKSLLDPPMRSGHALITCAEYYFADYGQKES